MHVTAAPPKAPSPKPPRARKRGGQAKSDGFAARPVINNPIAARAYTVSLYGLIPLVGAVCGPTAIALALTGWARRQRKPEISGGNFIAASLTFGILETLTHTFGLACIARGLGWL